MVISDSFRNILLEGNKTEKFGAIIGFCADNSIEIDASHREQILFLSSIKAETQEEYSQKIEDELKNFKNPPRGPERFNH